METKYRDSCVGLVAHPPFMVGSETNLEVRFARNLTYKPPYIEIPL